MSKYNLKRFIRIVSLITLLPIVYMIINLGNSSLYHRGHINDLKLINKLWNHGLFEISGFLIFILTGLTTILSISYFIVYSSKIKSFISKIVNFRFYLKYKGTNWTRNEVRQLRRGEFRLKTIRGEILFLSMDNNNYEYAIKKTTDCHNQKIYVYLVNKEVVYKSESLYSEYLNDCINRYNHLSINRTSFNIPKEVSDIISIFRDSRTILRDNYLYIMMPEGYRQILSRDELDIIRNSFGTYDVDFTVNYISISPRRIIRNGRLRPLPNYF